MSSRDDPLRGNLGRVLPQGHVGQVEQPAIPQMAGIVRQKLAQEGDGPPGTPLQSMPARFPDGKKTGVLSVGGDAIVLLAQPQIGNRQQIPDHGKGLPRQLPRLPAGPRPARSVNSSMAASALPAPSEALSAS